MADVTAGGKPVDARARKLRERNMLYEIQAKLTSIMRQENDILAAEINIERIQESIDATREHIQAKQAELDEFKGGEVDG